MNAESFRQRAAASQTKRAQAEAPATNHPDNQRRRKPKARKHLNDTPNLSGLKPAKMVCVSARNKVVDVSTPAVALRKALLFGSTAHDAHPRVDCSCPQGRGHAPMLEGLPDGPQPG